MRPEELHLHHTLRDARLQFSRACAAVDAIHEYIDAQLEILAAAGSAKFSAGTLIHILRTAKATGIVEGDKARALMLQNFERNPLPSSQGERHE